MHIIIPLGDEVAANFTHPHEGAYLAMAVLAAREVFPDKSAAFVEIGSFLGCSTITMASVTDREIYSIDPHEGKWESEPIPSKDNKRYNYREQWGETFDRFMDNLVNYDVSHWIIPVREFSTNVDWPKLSDNKKIALLFIDGCHQYESARGDFNHFYPHFEPGAFIVWHDMSDRFPGVQKAVNELILQKKIYAVGISGSMLITRCM